MVDPLVAIFKEWGGRQDCGKLRGAVCGPVPPDRGRSGALRGNHSFGGAVLWRRKSL